MSSQVIEEKLLSAVVELCDILGKPALARDLGAANEMASITGRRIAVAGLVKRGKSTFVNRVVGQDLSPVNLLPETSSVLCFSRCDESRASGISFDGRVRKLSTKPSSFSKDVSRKARRPLLAASYRGNLNLPENFCLVDTPGAHETEVVANSLVESGMSPSLFHLCGGFIVVMGVPGLSAIDLQLLERVNKSAGQLPVRVLLKGLDSSISQTDLVEYSKDVLANVSNEIYVVTDENFDEAARLVESFSVSFFDHPNDAQEVSKLVIDSVLKELHRVLNSRDENEELDVTKSLLKNLPKDLAEGVRYFAPGARQTRLLRQRKAAKEAETQKYKSDLTAWVAKDKELRRSIVDSRLAVKEAEKNFRNEKPDSNFHMWIFLVSVGLLTAPIAILFPPAIFFGAILVIYYLVKQSKERSKFRKIEVMLIARIDTAKSNSLRARMLYENHQKRKPNKPIR
jgi:hypothetical protein